MAVFKKENIITEKMSDTFERRIAHLNKLMVVVCDFTNGPASQPDPPHTHKHEQISYVAEGELFLFLGDDKYHLVKGDIFTVPSNVPHCIQTLSSHVRLVDSFSPLRKDFIRDV